MLWGDIARKLERPKPNWNLIWPVWLKWIRKVSTNPLAAKQGLRKVSILCWVRRAVPCQGGGKGSVFNSKPSCPEDAQLPGLEFGDRELSEAPESTDWTANETHIQVPGHKWDAPEGAGERAGQAYFTHFSEALVNWKSSCWLKITKCAILLWEGLEGGFRELQTCLRHGVRN